MPESSTPQLHPPSWEIFDRHAPLVSARALDIFTSTGDINRFGARYRLARSLRSLDLDGYSSSITLGYTSLFKLLMTWSAFEFFLKSVRIDKRNAGQLLGEPERSALMVSIRAADPNCRILQFVRERTANRSFCRELDLCIANQPFDPLCIVPSIRHLFAHGELASSSGAGEGQRMSALCGVLTEGIFLAIDREFERRVALFETRVNDL